VTITGHSPTVPVSPTRLRPALPIEQYVITLPELRRRAYEAAQPVWDTGITSKAVEATYAVIDVLEDILESLGGYYPDGHFGSANARDYFSHVIASRFRWHRHVSEPDGHGNNGSIVLTLVAGAVLSDVERMIAQVVHSLTLNWEDGAQKDFTRWESEWSEPSAVDAYGDRHAPNARKMKPKLKWGCYEFEGEEGLFCIKCYETQARKHPTTRMNATQRQCAVCQTVIFA
jgi:hypothetical protein